MMVEQALAAGMAHHRAGRLAEAEGIYQHILTAQPEHAQALDLLGALLAQAGRADEGIAVLRRAVAADGRSVSALMNLALLLRGKAAAGEAMACYRRVLEIDPRHALAHNQLGELLRAAGQTDEAGRAFEAAVGCKPDYAKALLNLGNLRAAAGEFDAARGLYQRLLALQPDLLEGYMNLGNAFAGLRRFPEAIACYQHVLRERPDDLATRVNLGHALKAATRFEEAAAAFQEALDRETDPAARANLFPHLGDVLLELERFDEASAAYREAIRLCPTDPQRRRLLAQALRVQGKLDAALAVLDEALQLEPADVAGLQSRASLLVAMGQVDEAIALLRDLVSREPDNAPLGGNLLGILHYSPAYAQEQLCAEARHWARRHADALMPATPRHANDRSPTRRLRVGYVSPDFHGHPVGLNLLPLLRAHAREAVEIFCYAQEPHPDELTAEFQRLADTWRDVQGLSDARMADMIREDRIDILVDLALHTAGNRLLAFARKPAPVQVTCAGYPGTTGVATIDYRLTDLHLDPPEAGDGCSAEKPVRLETFWCYDPLAYNLPVAELPALRGEGVTFGCLNNFCKVHPGVIALWASVLRAAPRSRLVLLTGEGRHRAHTAALFASHGITPERLVFERPRPRIKYLELYNAIDVGLDTLPYNGHTTSLDSCWMGVPVVTLVGETIAGRAGLSQLTNLGMPELVARTPEQFAQIAIGLTNDPPRLAELRRSLRERMRASPLMDGPRFARHVEAAYRSMWQRWCAGP